MSGGRENDFSGMEYNIPEAGQGQAGGNAGSSAENAATFHKKSYDADRIRTGHSQADVKLFPLSSRATFLPYFPDTAELSTTPLRNAGVRNVRPNVHKTGNSSFKGF